MLTFLSFLLSIQALSKNNIPLIDNIDGIKVNIVYADHENPFFLAINENNYYIGIPKLEAISKGYDVPYIKGDINNCTTKEMFCVALDEYVFISPKIKETISIIKNNTIVTAYKINDQKIIGTGIVRGKYLTKDSSGFLFNPILVYQYIINKDGYVENIIISSENNISHDMSVKNLKLESSLGIKLN